MLSFFRNQKFLNTFLQLAFVAVVAVLVIAMIVTAKTNMEAIGMTSGFSFLQRTTGWDVGFSLIAFDSGSTYMRALLVGFINTIYSGVISLFLATVLGVTIGMARVSENATLRLLSTTYVEIFRNIPLLLQGLFWYAIVTNLPAPREVEPTFFGTMFTSRGFYFPVPALTREQLLIALALAIVTLIVLTKFLLLRGRLMSGVAYWASLLGGIGIAAAMFLLVPLFGQEPGTPLISWPELKGLRIRGGGVVMPELSALILALVFFGAAYIGEIVRGGLLSVKKGQIEAAKALGLSGFDIYWDIRIPLAVRAIIPPMGNQYIWLLKGTTIGLAIGFADLFMVSSTAINQSGQTIEILGLMMLGYLIINYSISTLMNAVNKAVAIKGHNTR